MAPQTGFGAFMEALPGMPRDAQFVTRFTVCSARWIAGTLLVQFVIQAFVLLLVRAGLAQRMTRTPSEPWARMLLGDIIGMIGVSIPPSLVEAALRPSWDYTLNPFVLIWQVQGFFAFFYMYYYWVHRALHSHPVLYRWTHKQHHEQSVIMGIATTTWFTPAEGLLTIGIPYAAALLADIAFARSSWWWLMAVWYTSFYAFALAHTGLKFNTFLPHLALNPMLLVLLFTGGAMSPQGHAGHHHNVSVNFGGLYRFWDDRQRTARGPPGQLPMGVAVYAYNTTWYFMATWAINAGLRCAWAAVHGDVRAAALLAAAVLAPAAPLAAAVDASGLRRWFSRLCVWDALRRELAISIAPGADGGAPFAARPGERYVFGYHPHGILARGAFFTFSLAGQASPVSGLDVRFAVHSLVLRVPVLRELAVLVGCTDVSWTSLKRTLVQEKSSVAICPGGWPEARYVGSYRLVLKQRFGFVKLAHVTGAALVPVLGIGESELYGAHGGWWQLLLPAKPRQLVVAFGDPIRAQEGEDVAGLHERYTSALRTLGLAHGVAVTIES